MGSRIVWTQVGIGSKRKWRFVSALRIRILGINRLSPSAAIALVYRAPCARAAWKYLPLEATFTRISEFGCGNGLPKTLS